jgi:uncharacterized membrane protein
VAGLRLTLSRFDQILEPTMKPFLPFALALVFPFAVQPASSQEAGSVDFATQIFPILEAKCLKCHQKEREENGRLVKPKHGLRLDYAEGIMKGGKDYPNETVVPGKPDASWLLKTLSLPTDDDLFMPPEGKADPATDAEKALIKAWIEQGAKFGDWKGEE